MNDQTDLFRAPTVADVTLDEQIRAVERELAMRASVYPRRVADGKMTPGERDSEILRMRAVLATLKAFQAPEPAPERSGPGPDARAVALEPNPMPRVGRVYLAQLAAGADHLHAPPRPALLYGALADGYEWHEVGGGWIPSTAVEAWVDVEALFAVLDAPADDAPAAGETRADGADLIAAVEHADGNAAAPEVVDRARHAELVDAASRVIATALLVLDAEPDDVGTEARAHAHDVVTVAREVLGSLAHTVPIRERDA